LFWIVALYFLAGIGSLIFYFFDFVRKLDKAEKDFREIVKAAFFVVMLWPFYWLFRAVIKHHGIGIM
jgi:uncharacterized membrane protein (DUF373 family)